MNKEAIHRRIHRPRCGARQSPERFTGEGVFPQVVSVFNGPWGTDEIVSIGAGGQLVLKFNTPVTDDPNNSYGIDLLVFGNAIFIDENWPNGECGSPPSLLGEGGLIEVSADAADIGQPCRMSRPMDCFRRRVS